MNEGVYKIIFSGPVGSGKTSAIKALSDIDPVVTDVKASDEVKKTKANTTVSMDYGVLRLSEKETVHLYGTPGQERFDFMWEILTMGGIGLVLLIDNTIDDPIAKLAEFLEHFSDFIEKTSVVVGISRTDIKSLPSIENYHQQLGEKTADIPIFSVDARSRKDMSLLIEALLFKLESD